MSPKKIPHFLQEMIRVNQAGEFGAKRIYEGMIDFTSNPAEKKLLEHMKDQEEKHLETFNYMIVKDRVRPTFLQPLWHVGGYLLGAVSAKMGASHACTIAVEEVIDAHYQEQIDQLEFFPEHAELKETIIEFQKDECDHKQIAQEHDKFASSALFQKVVRRITKTAITLSKKI